MQVGPAFSSSVFTSLATAIDRWASPSDPVASSKTATAAKPVQAPQPALKASFQPAPAIRPTVQDTIDVDRTLLTLRGS